MMMMAGSSSLLLRRSLTRQSARNFSLLVPLQTRAEVPAEVLSTPVSDKYFADLEASYAQFNENCLSELQEMNQNMITNIMNRGGHDGWETAENLDYMRKSFEFRSFEEANHFIQGVAKTANKLDHHPEWNVSNNGTVVNANLTSHFAGNKVTRLDFELAEAMNNQFILTSSQFKQNPWFTAKQWASFKIGVGAFIFGSFFFKFVTGSNHVERNIPRVSVPPTGDLKLDLKDVVFQGYADIQSRDPQTLDAYGYYKFMNRPSAPFISN